VLPASLVSNRPATPGYRDNAWMIDSPDEAIHDEAERRAIEVAHRLLNTPPVKRAGKQKRIRIQKPTEKRRPIYRPGDAAMTLPGL
jgi:hypothetical protein